MLKMIAGLGCIILVWMGGLGCVGEGDSESMPLEDGPMERAFVGGKADRVVGKCEEEMILLWVNDPATTADELSDRGVHRRAAEEIEASGSVESLEELDEVYFVGPAAFRQLKTAVSDVCDDGRRAEVIFAPGGPGHISGAVELIGGAKRSVDLAIYRMSDRRVINALKAASSKGIEVRLLFDEANGDHLRLDGSTSEELLEAGVEVRFINRNMHHKMMIIDGVHRRLWEASTTAVMVGSANFGFFEERRYDNHMVIHRRDVALVLAVQREFNHLWAHSRDVLGGVEGAAVPMEISVPEFIDGEGIEVWVTSANFEVTHSTRWGYGFRPIEGSQVVAQRLVALIDSAETQIDVAARFLRSRPIAEAVKRRAREADGPMVRVYSDQGEFVSVEDQEYEDQRLRDCLVAADRASDERHCRDVGRRFSRRIREAGAALRLKTYGYRWAVARARQMHHKYMVIDGRWLAMGSYNLSHHSEHHSMETLLIYDGRRYPMVVKVFEQNFELLWSGRRSGVEDWLEELDDSDEIALWFKPQSLELEELEAYRDLVEQRCPLVESEAFRQRPQDFDHCEAISQ